MNLRTSFYLQNSVILSEGVAGSLTADLEERLRVGVLEPSGHDMLRLIICLRESGNGLPTLVPKWVEDIA